MGTANFIKTCPSCGKEFRPSNRWRERKHKTACCSRRCAGLFTSEVTRVVIDDQQQLISRSKAIALGLPRYFNGTKCKNGHICERLVSNWTCVKCNCLQTRRFNDANLDYLDKFRRRWNEANPAKRVANCARRRATKRNATPAWADVNALNEIYLKRPTGYDVDHIVPLVSPIVCGLHVPWNLQYLPRTENRKKSNRLAG